MNITLYKIGDFYEAIGDAELVREVEAATGRRISRVSANSPYGPLGAFTVGIPYHALDETLSCLRTRGNTVQIDAVRASSMSYVYNGWRRQLDALGVTMSQKPKPTPKDGPTETVKQDPATRENFGGGIQRKDREGEKPIPPTEDGQA